MKSFPDFTFYETEWKCKFPSEWTGIPLMQIPEYEYDEECIENLQNCPEECFCHHSWRLGNVTVANYMKSGKHTQNELLVELPDSTSNLILSHNNIRTLCRNCPYLKDLLFLDLGWNNLQHICPSAFKGLVNLQNSTSG